MKEDRNKWVRDIDQPVFDKLTRAMQMGASEQQTFIMDSFAQLFSHETNATYAANKATYFSDANMFASQVRNVKPDKLGKAELKAIAERINRNSSGGEGDVQLYMTNVNNTM